MAAFARDVSFISARDIPRVNWASAGMILLIVALSFRSLSIPLLLVSGIQLAIFFNLAFAWMFGTSLPFITVTSIGAIQLGATVDYAILLMTRYREERQHLKPEAAMIAALSEAAPAIATSALCLFSATIGVVFVNDIRMIESMCLLIARGAIISMLVILSLLPAVIVCCDKIINRTTWGGSKALPEQN
ncbi:MAG: putative membrane protein YdgH [Deltaproteobacteria bacterium ADurb.Bin510]|nr:MAG: putative membrane protein YdgH [Deltaproteobacteria bacterium ADurb.Bin510]